MSLEPRVLDNELLRTFLAIAETGSFTHAASAVLRTPSAISMQMRRLEDSLGKELFARDGRNVRLTADGEALLGPARRLVHMNAELFAQFAAPEMTGVVRLGVPDDFATLLPDILVRFARTHPRVQVDLVCDDSRELLAQLAAGRLDLVVISYGRNGGQPEDAEPLATDTIVWVGAVGGQAHERRPLPIAVSSPSCAWRATAIDALERAGVPFRIAYSSANYAGQYAAVAAGLAVATFAPSGIDERLRRLGPQDGLPHLPRYQLWLKAREGAETPALTALTEHVRASFAD